MLSRVALESANLLKVSLVAAVAMLAMCLLALVEVPNTAEAKDSLPHNDRIAVTGGGGVHTIEPDGSNPMVVTTNNMVTLKVSWSPDGTKIAFAREVPEGHYRFSVVEPDGSNLRDLPLTELPTGILPVSGPTWSPDGQKLAFSLHTLNAGPTPNRDIYTIDSDGSNLTNLTNTPGLEDFNPAYSPDGSQMCLYHASGRATPPAGIYVMDADGSDPTLLVEDADADQCDWSPDGKKIVFHSEKDGDFDIYTMDADGSGLTKLTSNSIPDQNPDWSPDGRKIAYASGRPKRMVIHTMDADGSDFARVNNTVGSIGTLFPDWQPLPRPTSPKSHRATVHPPDTGGPSLLLVASALLFSMRCLLYAMVRPRM